MAAGTEHFWTNFTSLVAPITNFSAMAAIVYFGARKSLPAAFAARSESVKETMDRASQEFEKAQKDHDHWQAQWSQSEVQAKQMQVDAEASISRIRTEVLGAAEKQAERIQKDSRLIAENEARRATLALQKEIAEQSIEMVENYCESSLKGSAQKKLVNKSLESIGG